MRDWTDLESEFNALADALRLERLDYHGGAGGDHWRLAGGADPLALRRFETLARIAGTELLAVPAIAEIPTVAQEADPLYRWYRALKELSGAYRPGKIMQLMDGERPAGIIYSGTVDRVAEASALLCLQCVAATPHIPVETTTPPRVEKPDIVELKPGLWGLSIDLRALWRTIRGVKVESR